MGVTMAMTKSLLFLYQLAEKAISTITKYVDVIDDPIARKIDSLLSAFNRQLRLDEVKSLKGSTLTNYFRS
jgi:hypothetical protein